MVIGNAVIQRQRSIQELSFACICNIIMMKCATRDNIWTAIESNYSVVHMISDESSCMNKKKAAINGSELSVSNGIKIVA